MVRRRRRIAIGTAAGRALGGAVLVLAGVVLLLPVGRGVSVEVVAAGSDATVPLHVYVPDTAARDAAAGTAGPGVVVAHGFAGSARLMHSWSLALATAGFTVVAPDLPGHGASSTPMDGPVSLAAALDVAIAHLAGLPSVDAGRVALLGHSMGAGAVLERGIVRPDRVRAVVAVSPTDGPVDASLPRDLLLLAGANEARFVANAESLLGRAGGERGMPGDEDARRLIIVPRVEHVSILFSRRAQDASIDWMASALDHTPDARAPFGPIRGWALLAVGLLVLWQAIGLSATTPALPPQRRRGAWLALGAGGVAATASLVILVRSVDVSVGLGMLVAGEVGLWFLMTGAVWLRFGPRPSAPDVRDVGWAVLATGALVGLGASTVSAWSPWWLPGVRVVPALLLMLAVLPFSIAAAAMLHGRRGASALGAWAATATVVVVTLAGAAIVVPGLGFLLLVLPVLPLILATMSVVAVGIDRPWASGAAGAVFLGWLLATLFPLT